MSRARYVAPNAISAANIGCGFAAVIVAAEGHFEAAVYLLLLSITLDMSDGFVARKLRATSKFGQEMDSFSDALSFGAAPAFLLYFAFLRPFGGWGLACSLVFLLAAILRLARFNLTTNEHVKDDRTVGVPTPIAASYVMAAVLLRDDLGPGTAATLALTLAAGMLSRVRLPNLKGRTVVTVMLLVGIANYMLVVFAPSWTTVAWWNVWNVLILAVAKAHERRGAEDEPPCEHPA